MEQAYYELVRPDSFGGVRALSRNANKGLDETREWLRGQETYTLHKPVRRKFQRRKTFTVGIDHLWQIDLVDLSSISRYNRGYKFILTCIDCFSRFAWAVPIKSKKSTAVLNAFASILESGDRKPTYLQSDKGTEFLNSSFQSYLKRLGILFYTSQNEDIKCALVERFNRTLKTKMWKYFTYRNTLGYLDVLSDLMNSYNQSYHSAIKTAPSLVNIHNESKIRRVLYPPKRATKVKWKYNVGDTVRLAKGKREFRKGYLPGWTREIFKISERVPTNPPVYHLIDEAKDKVKGKFYAEELQAINKSDDVFRIEKVIRTRRKLGKIQYLVRWLGYPPKFDSWVDNILR
jgi:hypothetical protein